LCSSLAMMSLATVSLLGQQRLTFERTLEQHTRLVPLALSRTL
jgi:hypothetical protein